MKNVYMYVCLLMLFIIGCKSNNDGKIEKFQRRRNKIINVENSINDIKTSIFFKESVLNIIDSILIVNEGQPSNEKGIHLFNKNTFKYITSTGIIGKGPGEIILPGRIGVDSKNKILWVPDHGKRILLKFFLDSILNNEMYKPTNKIDLHLDLFLERFDFLDDSIALGKAVHVIDNHSFNMVVAKVNLNTNKTEKFGYEHPETIGKKSNSLFKLSLKDSIYVNCYVYCDLMTICDLQGNLKYNVYGPGWQKNEDNRNSYFFGLDLMKNYIITSYLGDVSTVFNEFKRPKGNLPTKFQIFDLKGNYIKTIETGHKFQFFCVDEENNRVIIYFEDRENPLGYIDLDLD